MNRHKLALAKVCRIGGRKFTSLSRPTEYPAREFVSDLRHCFGVDVERDEEDIHPPSICTICRRQVSRYRDALASGRALYSFVPRGGGSRPLHGRAGRDKKFHLQQAFFKDLKRPSFFCSSRKGNGGRRRVGEEHAHSFKLKAYEW